MKKLLTVLLSLVSVCCLAVGAACASEHTAHTWVASGETDENGNAVYVCSECGETHEHTFSDEWTYGDDTHWHAATCEHSDAKSGEAAHTMVESGETADGEIIYTCSVCGYQSTHAHTYSSSWTYDSEAHWHASTCGHDVTSGYEAHMFGDDGVCEVCGYAQPAEYEILFAYYTDDNGDGAYDGNSAYDEDGNEVYDTYRGVTYTAVEYNGLTVNIDGDTLQAGDAFAFTVKKSVYCEYTDSRSYCLVTVVYMNEDGELDDYTVEPDSDGLYVVTVESDTVITVTNVESMSMTIGGSGTESNPYTINSVVDWLYFASLINDKDWYGISYNIAYWKLTCDLDFEGEEVYIVGDGYTTSYSMFMGSFDGGGNTLSNFVITNDVYGSSGEYSTYVGLFGILSGYAGVDTTIKNLNVENYSIAAGASADSVVAVGGLVGYVAGASVVNCNVSGCEISIAADDDYSAYAGGITGMIQSGYSESEGVIFYASIQYCSVDADISGTGYLYQVGGIAGRTVPYGAISPIFIYNCYTEGLYTDSAQAGGIVAYAGRYTSIQNCYSTAEITSYNTQTGYTYADTMFDYRYSYAGGIVGYAENDTVISGCFFAGVLSASSDSGTAYAKTGNIIAAYCEAGYEDYRAEATLLINNIETTSVTDDDIKNTLGWNTVDWTFNGDGRPVINTETSSYTFIVTVVIGSESYTYTIDSLYRPMAYWYLQASQGTATALAEYLTSGTNRTYGYYFDAALTQRVPLSYVPMDNVTLYAGYANYAAVAGEYAINANGISATLTLEADGTYELSYGAIYLTGEYEYNGTYITMTESYFSRFISTATTTQQETYFTFWAEINADGDLEIYDCETLNEITDTYDGYGFTYLARLVTKDSPLKAVVSANTQICGSYYDASDSDNVFTFEIGYTGSAYISGASRDITYSYENGTLYVVMNGVTYTATVSSGKIVSLENSSGATVYTLVAYDDFEGTWEQSATINKKYTFDGKGEWEYYVDGTYVDGGTYTINSNGALTFTRDNITVTVTMDSDGTLNVKESTGSVAVTYYGEGGYQGTWYTAAITGNKYTLELSGILGDGYGLLDLSGAGVSLEDMRYVSVGGVLYVYDGDTLYATLTYDSAAGTLTGLFYNSSTDSLSTSYLFYLYDDFQGDWFSSVSGLEKLTFNGLGAYDVEAYVPANPDAASSEEATLAVKGKVYVNDSTTAIQYYINSNGEYEFVYNGVTYIIEYDENNNEVTLSYNGTTAKLTAGDSLYGVVYVVNGETYEFNGGGNTSGGTVVITAADGTEKSGTYVINSTTGVVTVTCGGSTYATFTPVTANGETTGYTVTTGGGTYTAAVENDFTGTWVIVGGYASITVPEISYFVSGTVVDLTVYYTSEGYDDEPINAYYDGTDIWFYLDSTTVYYISSVYGTLFMSTTYTAGSSAFSMVEPDGWLAFYKNSEGNVIALGGDSNYSSYKGYGDADLGTAGESGGVLGDTDETLYMYKADADGNITIYLVEEDDDGNDVFTAVYTFNVTANGEYEYNGEYRSLVAITAAE